MSQPQRPAGGWSSRDVDSDIDRPRDDDLLTPATLSWLMCAPLVLGGWVPWDIIHVVSALALSRRAGFSKARPRSIEADGCRAAADVRGAGRKRW
jgi:hypothetical protein